MGGVTAMLRGLGVGSRPARRGGFDHHIVRTHKTTIAVRRERQPARLEAAAESPGLLQAVSSTEFATAARITELDSSPSEPVTICAVVLLFAGRFGRFRGGGVAHRRRRRMHPAAADTVAALLCRQMENLCVELGSEPESSTCARTDVTTR